MYQVLSLYSWGAILRVLHSINPSPVSLRDPGPSADVASVAETHINEPPTLRGCQSLSSRGTEQKEPNAVVPWESPEEHCTPRHAQAGALLGRP